MLEDLESIDRAPVKGLDNLPYSDDSEDIDSQEPIMSREDNVIMTDESKQQIKKRTKTEQKREATPSPSDYLSERKYVFFPCKKDNKRPDGVMAWQNLDQCIAVDTSANMIGLQCGERNNLTVIDLDNKSGEVNGLKWWKRMVRFFEGELHPETPTVITPSGGKHIYYLFEKLVRTRSACIKITIDKSTTIDAAIDTRSEGGYVICPPSTRTDGKAYTFANYPPHKSGWAKVPAWFIEACRCGLEYDSQTKAFSMKEIERKDHAEAAAECKDISVNDFNPGRFRRMVMGLAKERADSRSIWMEVVFSISAVAKRHEVNMLPLAIEFSRQSEKFKSEAEVERLYNDAHENSFTERTIWCYLKDDDKQLYYELSREHNREFGLRYYEDYRKLKKYRDAAGNIPMFRVKNYIVNTFVKISEGGDCRIFVRRLDHGVEKWEAKKAPFKLNNFTVSKDAKTGEKTSIETIFQEMCKEEEVDAYDSVVFRPWLKPEEKEIDNDFNIFKQFPMAYNAQYSKEQFQQDTRLIKRITNHMRDELCNGDKAVYSYYLKYIAHTFQKSAEKPGTGIIFITKEGKGKDIINSVLLGKLLGDYNIAHIGNFSQLGRDFNKELEGKLLVNVGEAQDFEKRGHNVDAIKDFLTNPVQRIEPKGLEAYSVANFARMIAHTNNLNCCAPSANDRRLLIVASLGPVKSTQYFAELMADINDPRVQRAMFDVLTHMKLDDFNPRVLPITDIKKELQQTHFSAAERFMIEFNESLDSAPKRIHADELYEKYGNFCTANGERLKAKKTNFMLNIKALVGAPKRLKIDGIPRVGFIITKAELSDRLRSELKYSAPPLHREDDDEDAKTVVADCVDEKNG